MNIERQAVLYYVHEFCKKTILYHLNAISDRTIEKDWYFRKCQPIYFQKCLKMLDVNTNIFDGGIIGPFLLDPQQIKISTWCGIKCCILSAYNFLLGFLKSHEKVFMCLPDTQVKVIQRVLAEASQEEMYQLEKNIFRWVEVTLRYDSYLCYICCSVSQFTISTDKKAQVKKTLNYFYHLYTNKKTKYIDNGKAHDVRFLWLCRILYERIILELQFTQNCLDDLKMLRSLQRCHEGYQNTFFDLSSSKGISGQIIIKGRDDQLGDLVLLSPLKKYNVRETYQLLLESLPHYYYADRKLSHNLLHGETDHLIYDDGVSDIINPSPTDLWRLSSLNLWYYKNTLNRLLNQLDEDHNLLVFKKVSDKPTVCEKKKLFIFYYQTDVEALSNYRNNCVKEFLLWMAIRNSYILTRSKICHV